MSSAIDGLDTKSFSISTKIRYSYGRIWTFHVRKVVWNFELSTQHPIHSRGFDIECRKMNDPCKFRCIKDTSMMSDVAMDVDILKFLGFSDFERVSLWIREDIHTSSEFIQNEWITSILTNIFKDRNIDSISIRFCLEFILSSFFIMFCMIRMIFIFWILY